MPRSKTLALISGPFLGAAIALPLVLTTELSGQACFVAGLAAWCALWWVLEPLDVAATSLLPFCALPAAGVLTHSQVATAYGHTVVLLFMAGFFLSRALEESGAHEQVALRLVQAVGAGKPRRLVLGFMVASAALSMWISNTATTLMMLPIVTAVVDRQSKPDPRFARGLLLGVAYAATIGGLGTPIGSPPNLVFMAVHNETAVQPISFLGWIAVSLPVVVIMLPLTWLLLTRRFQPSLGIEVPTASPLSPPQKRVLCVFAAVALLWVTRAQPGGGWSALLEQAVHFAGKAGSLAGDSTAGLLGVLALFVIPREPGSEKKLLSWRQASQIPWGILLLFGAGIALAKGFSTSGLSAALGQGLGGAQSFSALALVAGTALLAIFLTEIISNTAAANLLMPVLAAVATATGISHARVMMPAALCCTLAFMLPVSTPPNAIVFGTGRVATRDMMRVGALLNALGVAVVAAVVSLLLG